MSTADQNGGSSPAEDPTVAGTGNPDAGLVPEARRLALDAALRMSPSGSGSAEAIVNNARAIAAFLEQG